MMQGKNDRKCCNFFMTGSCTKNFMEFRHFGSISSKFSSLMKPFPLFSLLIFIFPMIGHTQSDSAVVKKLYGIKSCKIVFKFYNGPQSGVKTIIFDDWGNMEKEEVITFSDTAIMGKALRQLSGGKFHDTIPGVQHNLRIRTAQEIYTIDVSQQVGYKTRSFALFDQTTMMNSMTTAVGTDTLLGKPCRIVEMQHAFRLWMWDNIALKKQLVQEVPDMKMEEYAIEVDDNYVIKPDEFTVPANIKIQ